MTDFKYDSYDQTSMRVAFQNLRQTERTAFYLGLVGGGIMGAVSLTQFRAQSRFRIPLSMQLAVPLLAGSLIYGVYSWGARSDYSEAASKVNRKYSRIINKVINYE